MAIPHLNLSHISKANGQSAIAASAYRNRGRLYDLEEQALKNYASRQSDLVYSQVILPRGACAKFGDRGHLWNEVHRAETRRNARVAHELDVALPHEFMRNDNAENIALSRCFAAFLVEHTGAAVEFNIHRPDVEKGQDARNIHVHFMFTPRRLGPYGFEDKLPAMREGRAFLIHMRKVWEEMCNEFLLKGDIRNAKGEIEQISMDTLEAQGIDRLPQIHEGPKGRAMQQEGRTPVSSVKEDGNSRAINYPEIDNGKTRGEYNAEIIELNQRKEDICGPININTQIENVERQIDIHLENIAEIEALLPLNFLPEHIRAKLRVAIERFQKLLFMRLFEKMARKKRKKELETLRLQKRVERLRLALLDYERKQSRLLAVKYLYLKMNANYLYVDHALLRVNAPKPLVTRLDFREKIKVNSKALRMNVIPEYRPKMKERHSRYEDNGGNARPPPPIREPFNAAAQGVVPKQKVKVTFGPHAQRLN